MVGGDSNDSEEPRCVRDGVFADVPLPLWRRTRVERNERFRPSPGNA
jgi:hypothetical protein